MSEFNKVVITSEDGASSMTFLPERGGAACSLVMPGKDGARELLYTHDFFFSDDRERMPGGWPFLFPVCARVKRDGVRGVYNYQGQQYHLTSHGFAFTSEWEYETPSDSEIILRLRDSEATRELYPFEFLVELHYKLSDGMLVCKQSYTNNGKQPMPYSAGFHPYFAVPIDEKPNTILNYEPKQRWIFSEDLTDIVGHGEVFATPTPVDNPEINEQLTVVGENKLAQMTFANGDRLQIMAEGVEDPDLFPFLQLYHMPEKPFFCIEPWMAQPNAINSVSGIRWLAPKQSEHGVLTLRLV